MPLADAQELLVDPVGEDDQAWLASLWAESPELQALADEPGERPARRGPGAPGRRSKPVWGLEAGYANRGSLDPMWRAGLSLSLPAATRAWPRAWPRPRPAGSSAAARQQAQQADLALFVRQRLLALRAVERSVTVYEQGLLPQGRLTIEAALASYQAGKMPFVTVLEAQASLYADRAAWLALLAGHATLRAGLEEIQVESSDLPALVPAPVTGPSAAGAAMSMGR